MQVITDHVSGYPEQEVFEDVPIRRLPPLLDGTKGLVKFLDHAEDRPDVIQFLSMPPKLFPTLRKLRREQIPTIYVNTMVSNLASNPLRRLAQRNIRRLVRNQLSGITTSSQTMLEELRVLRLKRPVIRVIPNGVDLSRFYPVSNSDEKLVIRRELGIPKDKFVVLFIGYLTPRKGIDVLVESWPSIVQQQPDAHLVLVGPRTKQDDTQMARFYKRMDATLASVPGTASFMGSRTDVERFYRAADLFVFLSRREGMPNVVPEAMACGLPVVMTSFLGISKEFGVPGRHYELVERNVGAVSKAIVGLIRDQDQATTLGKSGRDWIRETMSVESSLDRYANFYHEIVHRVR